MEEGGYGHRILKKLDGLNWKLIASIEPGTEVSKASRKFDIKSEIGFHLESNNSFGYGIHIPIGEKEFSKEDFYFLSNCLQVWEQFNEFL